MKCTLMLTALCLAGCFGFAGDCSAQYNIDLDALRRDQQAMMDRMNQQIQETQRYQEQLQAQTIQSYRQETGDYSTPDAQVFNYLQQQYYAQNPAAYQQKLAEDQYVAREMQRINNQMHADNMAGFRARSQIISDTANEINAMSMNGHYNRMNSMDRMHTQNINAIYEQSRYLDPTTGQTVDLSFHPNQWQSTNGQYYYTDGWGRQFLYQPNQGYQQLDEYDR
jgi:hypothetical protein